MSSILTVDGAGAVGAVFLVERDHASLLHVFLCGSMQLFLEDWIGFVDLELGLEITEGLSRGIGAAADVVDVVAKVFSFDALSAPVKCQLRGAEDCSGRLTSFHDLRRAS